MSEAVDIPEPFAVTSETYAAACKRAGIKGGVPGAIDRYRRLYREGVPDQPGLRTEPPRIGRVIESESPEGVVRKLTLSLGPAAPGVYERAGDRMADTPPLETESVIIPMIGKKRIRTHTLCVSSQVGCAMGCTFCQTAQ